MPEKFLHASKSFAKWLLTPSIRRSLQGLLFEIRRPFLLTRALQINSRLITQSPGRKTVLFFAPEAGVTPYLMLQAIIGKALQERGHNVLFVRCFNLLRRCPVKEMVHLPYDATPRQSLNVCINCWRASDAILSQYELDYIDMRELIDDSTKHKVAQAINNLPDNRLEFRYENIPVGNLAFYDFGIANKHPAKEPIDVEEYCIFDQYLETGVMAVEMMKAIISRFQISTLASFDEYGMMSATRLYARNYDILLRMVSVAYHLNGDWRRAIGTSNLSIVKEQAWRLAQWPKWRELSLPEVMVKEVVDDLVFRLTNSGSHIYSPNKTLETDKLFAQLGLSRDRKTLVAFTSSTDEHDALIYSIRGLGYQDISACGAFRDTFEWLHDLIEYVEASDDLQLIIRLHPRIAATARDNIYSKDYQRYRDELSGAYAHTKLVWPEERVSSYDLAEFADVALITWSSMGLELARMGVPVLSGYPSIFSLAPNDGFIVTALDKIGYFDCLRQLLAPHSSSHVAHMIRLSFRWYHMAHLGNSIDISDIVNDRDIRKLPLFRLPENSKIIEEVFVNDKDAITYNLDKLIEVQSSVSCAKESHALAGELGRLIAFLCTGEDKDVTITVVVAKEAGTGKLDELVLDGDYVEYSFSNGLCRRYSPLVTRLGRAYIALTQGQGHQLH